MADTARAAAIKALEDAVEAFMALQREMYEDYGDVLAVDAVLIVGAQWIDSEGDRCGDAGLLPRNGSQPAYITRGLVDDARAKLNRPIPVDDN